ncbi:MAG: FHA domain-containing protein [Thermoleophilia bacterium]|nr:FHA domain-containing protein [Thermoleophilia bacterium]
MLQVVLLVGKFLFLAILYAFVIRLVRIAAKELKASGAVSVSYQATGATGQFAPHVHRESPTFEKNLAREETWERTDAGWKLVVEKSPCLAVGSSFFLPVGGHMLAGRAPEMDIHLSDTFVSSKHALFEALPTGLVVEDLRSTNGTQVNGVDITEPTQLRPGDKVEIGDTIFRVEVQ